ncbi:uncharacterized protein LOC107427551 [Ziziphus jujuba]|uniref:Uncharacterized protein LOC107427551 n=1 Tax=Ziziphus jujuba TaxID=326968 RepID=A0A6P4AW33_ZIZJJ|nr:uncharacterized protein LOC107427551 [Ziziphus jujuba]
MAGILPGVEYARRRHVGSSTNGCIRKSSFCLYATQHSSSSTSLLKKKKSTMKQACQDDDQKLGIEAREAKERLDQKLGTHCKRGGLRSYGEERCNMVNQSRELHTEVYCSKKDGSSSKFMSWAKLSWKASGQDEFCAVCLERFRGGETLVHLSCAHRLHSECLLPWLENNEQCPCCRLGIITLLH